MAGRPCACRQLVGASTPVTTVDGPDGLVLGAAALGEPEPVPYVRLSGDTFARRGEEPGGMTVAVNGNLLYLGPFALPRS